MSFTVKKTAFALALICIGASIGAGAAYAYFSSSSQSDFNMFTNARVGITVSQDASLQVASWLPGETHVLEWGVTNVGTVDTYLKGKFDAEWDAEELSSNLIEIRDIEYFDGTSWQPLVDGPIEPGAEFLYSADQSESGLIVFEQGQERRFRMAITLSENAGNEYQGASVTGQVKMGARQIGENIPWDTL